MTTPNIINDDNIHKLSATEFNKNEDNIFDMVITNLYNMLQNCEYKIGVMYISTYGLQKPCRYMIFYPFHDYPNNSQNQSTISYIFVKKCIINVSREFYKWIYYQNKVTIIEIKNPYTFESDISTGNLDLIVSTNNVIYGADTFDEWFEHKLPYMYNLELIITNPFIYRVPFPVKHLKIIGDKIERID